MCQCRFRWVIDAFWFICVSCLVWVLHYIYVCVKTFPFQAYAELSRQAMNRYRKLSIRCDARSIFSGGERALTLHPAGVFDRNLCKIARDLCSVNWTSIYVGQYRVRYEMIYKKNSNALPFIGLLLLLCYIRWGC